MSKKYCCVPGCSESGGSHSVLHVFPNPEKEPDRFRSWVLAVGGDILGLDNNWIYKNRRVCHQHFDEQYCYYSNKLSQLAIPTKNLPGPTTISEFTFSGQRVMRDIDNIEKDKPSTSKDSCGLFGMDIDDENQKMVQSSASATEKSINKENIVPVEEVHCVVKTSDISFEGSSTSLQYLSVPVAEGNIKIDKWHSTAAQHLAARTASSVKGKHKSCIISKQEQALSKRLRLLQIKLSKCRSQNKKFAKSLKMAQNVMTNQSFLKTIENMTTSGRTLTLLQFRELKKKGKGRRFTLKEKIMAMSIYKQSPKSYRLLRKILVLPAAQTLDKVVQKAIVTPFFDEKVFKQLKEKAEKMKTDDKLCVLLFDEIALQAHLNYSIKEDKVNGLVGYGNETKFANHALVFMLRGLIKNFKQPIAYMFCSGATCAANLKQYIIEIIKRIQEAGFRIIATICDQGSNNQKAIKSLVEDHRKIKLRNGEELRQNTFMVNSSEIIPLYDPPHLLKGIRNNLLQKKLQYTNEGKKCIAKWDHIEMLYAENPAYKGLRLVPKLTEQHVVKEKIGKMKVKLASQIFSQSVGLVMGYLAEKGILPAECKDTADLLILFDKLFDSMNASYGKKDKHGKPYLSSITPTSIHNKLWREVKKVMSTMTFINDDGKSKTTPSLENFIWTIEGLQYLVKILPDLNIAAFWTRNLNQDPLENFFGSIRSHGCRNNNPSPAAFQSAYTALLINNLTSVHAAGSNCEDDFCESLEAFVVNPLVMTNQNVRQVNMEHLLINITPLEEKKINVKEIACLTYVSGFFLKKCKKLIFRNCKECNDTLFDKNKKNEYLKYREYSKRSWLCYPNDHFLNLISAIQDIFYEIIKDKYSNNNLLQYVKLVLDFHIDATNITKCNAHKSRLIDFMYTYVLRFFVRSYCKDINKILTGRRKNDDVNDFLKNQAEMYYTKCLKIKKK